MIMHACKQLLKRRFQIQCTYNNYIYVHVYNIYFLISLRPILGILTTCILLYVCEFIYEIKIFKGSRGGGGCIYVLLLQYNS